MVRSHDSHVGTVKRVHVKIHLVEILYVDSRKQIIRRTVAQSEACRNLRGGRDIVFLDLLHLGIAEGIRQDGTGSRVFLVDIVRFPVRYRKIVHDKLAVVVDGLGDVRRRSIDIIAPVQCAEN